MNEREFSFSIPTCKLQNNKLQNEIPPQLFSDSNTLSPRSEIFSPRSSFTVQTIINSAKLLKTRVELQPGSRRASTLTVITSMVGAGILALPFAMMRSGILPTVCYIIIIAIMCAWALHALIIVGQHTGAHSFYDIADVLFGRTVAIVVEFLIIANLILASVAYLTMVKNILPLILQILTHSSSFWDSKFFVVPLVTFVIILFLALKRRVSALRYTSLLVLLLVCYLTVITTVKFAQYCGGACTGYLVYGPSAISSNSAIESQPTYDFQGVKLWESSWRGHFYTLPILLTSYAAQPTVLPIYIELQSRSPTEMWIVISSGLTVTVLLYITLSMFGYLTFLSKTEPNYLMSDYHGDLAIVIAGLGFCLVTSFGVPLMIHAVRRSIITLYYSPHMPTGNLDMRKPLLNTTDGGNWGIGSFVDVTRKQSLVETPDCTFAFRRPQFMRDINKRSSNQLPLCAHLGVTLGILIVVCIAALFFPNLGVVMAFVGSTVFPAIGYVFPMLSVWKLRWIERKQISNKLLVIISFFGLTASLIALFGIVEQLISIM